MTERIIIIVEGQDKGANKVLGDLQKNLKDADQAASKASAGGLNALVGKLAGFGAVSLAGQAMLQFGKDSIQAASDAEEAGSKFDTVFREQAPAARAEIDAFADAANRSGIEMQGMAANIQDTLVPMGIARDEAAGLSVDVVKLAADLGSFNNMPMDEALQRLQGTLVGSHENALAFGVVINENTLKAELAAQGWDKLTGKQLEAAKVQARLNLLYAGTSDAQGDAIRTADSLANKMAGLDAATLDLQVSLGNLMAPAAEFFVDTLTQGAENLQIVTDGLGSVMSAMQQQGQAAVANNLTWEQYIESLGVAGPVIEQLNELRGDDIRLAFEEAQRIANVSTELEKEREARELVKSGQEERIEASSEEVEALTSLQEAIAGVAEGMNFEKASGDLLNDALKTQGETTSELNEAKIQLLFVTGQITAAERDQMLAQNEQILTLERLNGMLENGMVSWEQYLQIVADGVVTQEEMGQALAETWSETLDASIAASAEETAQMTDVMQGLYDTTDDADEKLGLFTGSVDDASGVLETLRDRAMQSTDEVLALEGAANDLALELENISGEYNIHFNITQSGAIPSIPGQGEGQGGTSGAAFQAGGIVPGSFLEPVPAIVHGGEMVLNPTQQQRLFGLLNGEGTGGGGMGGAKGEPVVVQVFIDGKQITEGVRFQLGRELREARRNA